MAVSISRCNSKDGREGYVAISSDGEPAQCHSSEFREGHCPRSALSDSDIGFPVGQGGCVAAVLSPPPELPTATVEWGPGLDGAVAPKPARVSVSPKGVALDDK